MRKAIFTIVHNEQYFLPIWLRYYSQFFSDIFVLNHVTTDGSVEKLSKEYNFYEKKINFKHLYDATFLHDTVLDYQKHFLTLYPIVVYADADEFIVPNPKVYSGLTDYIDKMNGDMARCNGYEVVQQEGEAGIDLNQPILQQRKYWVPNEPMCKTLISKIPLKWGLGLHGIEGGSPEIDKDLFMLHLKRMDREIFWKRWAETGLPNDPELIKEHMYLYDKRLQAMEVGANLIPEDLKGII